MSAANRPAPDFTRTREALAAYDAGQERRDALLRAVERPADVAVWEAAYREALSKVTYAYYLDTQDRNTRSKCEMLNEDDIRRIVRRATATLEVPDV